MLDIKFIRENQEVVRKAIADKQLNVNLDHLIALDDQRRKLIIETEAIRSRRNEISNKLKKAKDESLVKEAKKLKDDLAKLELELKEIEDQWLAAMYEIPNIPLADVPVGKDETENQEVKKWGEVPKFKFKVKDHIQLGEALDVIDVTTASKVSGSRFGYLKGAAAALELALIHYVFKILTSETILKKIADSVKKGYSPKPFVPVFPPVMIKEEVYTKTARLSEADKEDKYFIASDELYLIGSAEHTLVPMHMDEVLKEKDLPIRYVGFSTSFRREAGSYGKDVKGILRVHQFDKIEMESFTLPDDSFTEHLLHVAIEEYIMQSLNIPYHVLLKCTADIGNPNARGVDIEAWIPSQGRYRETHTADLMTDFQARRLNTKVKRSNGITEFVHTADATAIAMPRAIIAIMENYQQEDGSVLVPKVLQEFTGFDRIVAR